MFVFTWGVVDELHLLGILNFRVVDYGFFGVITLWYFQLFFCANYICSFIQHFNSSKFGVWCFLSMACTWSVLKFSDLYFQCSLSTICNFNFVIWLCLHYFLFEMLHFSLDLIFSKHPATMLLLLVPFVFVFCHVFYFVSWKHFKTYLWCNSSRSLTCVKPNEVIFWRSN